MIKWSGEQNGRRVFAFGLSDGNLERLREGRPIQVELEQMGGEGTVLIYWGQTEQQMYDDLKAFGAIGPDVIMHQQDDQADQPTDG